MLDNHNLLTHMHLFSKLMYLFEYYYYIIKKSFTYNFHSLKKKIIFLISLIIKNKDFTLKKVNEKGVVKSCGF